jgi:hypothetical protein
MIQEFKNLDQDSKLEFLKNIMPQRHRPCVINYPDGPVYGIFKSVKRGKGGIGLQGVILIIKKGLLFDENEPLALINRVSWDDFVFPKGDKMTKKLEIYKKGRAYYIVVDSDSKVFDKKPEKYYKLFSLSTARKPDAEQEFLDVPAREFDDQFVRMSSNDDPNSEKIKEVMFRSEFVEDLSILF